MHLRHLGYSREGSLSAQILDKLKNKVLPESKAMMQQAADDGSTYKGSIAKAGALCFLSAFGNEHSRVRSMVSSGATVLNRPACKLAATCFLKWSRLMTHITKRRRLSWLRRRWKARSRKPLKAKQAPPT